ncbi:MAG: hypothetical protein ABWJ98_02660 [Hydrogenothermaceae bacterium]
MTEEQINILIADAESFIYFQQKKIDKLIKEKNVLSLEDSSQIFKYIADSLSKIANLLSKIMEIESREKLTDILEISMNTIGWIIYTLPTLEIYTNLFPENFTIKDKDVLDHLAYNLIELENIASDTSILKSFSLDVADNLKEASSLLGHLSEISKKGLYFS